MNIFHKRYIFMLLFNLLKKKVKKLELEKPSFIYLQKKKSNKKYRFFIHINKKIKTCKSLHIIMTTNQDANFYNLHRKMTMFIIQPLEKKKLSLYVTAFFSQQQFKKTHKRVHVEKHFYSTILPGYLHTLLYILKGLKTHLCFVYHFQT